jgi:hypothetical protein
MLIGHKVHVHVDPLGEAYAAWRVHTRPWADLLQDMLPHIPDDGTADAVARLDVDTLAHIRFDEQGESLLRERLNANIGMYGDVILRDNAVKCSL